MKTLSMLKIAFDTNITAKELPAFRAALFHQIGTKEPNETSNHAYPLLQCKTRRSYDQQQPLVVCLGKSPGLFLQFSQQPEWKANLNGRQIEMRVAFAKATDFRLKCHEKRMPYQIFNYLALNQTHYPEFKKLTAKDAQKAFLAERLKHHILGFVRGIGWSIACQIHVEVNEIRRTKPIRYQNVTLQCFDLDFQCNVFIPEWVGLGKGVSHGYGVLRRGK